MRTSLHRHLTAALLLLTTAPAWAGQVDLQLTFEDFDRSAELDVQVRTVLTRIHAWNAEVLGLSFPTPVPLHVRLIADRSTYNARSAALLRRSESTLGFFVAGKGGYVWRNPDEQQMLGTLVHEAQHYLLSEGGARAPYWLSEGIAEVFERFRISGNAVYLDMDGPMLQWMRQHPEGRAMTVAALLHADRDAWSRLSDAPIGDAGRSYGWTLTALLMGTPHGRTTLRGIVHAYTRSRDDEGVVAAIDAHYPGGLRQLERDWRSWCEGSPKPLQLSIRAAEVDLAAPPACDGILMRKGTEVTCVR